ncbi:universal stress protein [Paenibacillus sp. HB172176]|uniref:universal stress protein n=1 Tax=Paenibacillus sp. HB172176 TaxID=2493690 RepID=UPI00143BF006|nr:universal stress protein [Paenibacillus sp. HB172176]
MYNHILIPTDGSKQADKALDTAIGLSKALPQVKLSVIHVNQHVYLVEPAINVNVSDVLEREAAKIISEASGKLTAAGCRFEILSGTGDPAQIICRAAEEQQADLIVMGSRGAGLVSEILIGSVSHNVVKHSHCPVLIVK